MNRESPSSWPKSDQIKARVSEKCAEPAEFSGQGGPLRPIWQISVGGGAQTLVVRYGRARGIQARCAGNKWQHKRTASVASAAVGIDRPDIDSLACVDLGLAVLVQMVPNMRADKVVLMLAIRTCGSPCELQWQ